MGLSQGIRYTPNSVGALLFPSVSCIVRGKSRKEGLCMKKTENALSAASLKLYGVFFPRRRSSNPSNVARICPATALPVRTDRLFESP